MKKLLSIMLAAVMLLSVMTVSAYADEPITFELVPSEYVHGQDDTVTVELRVKNNTGISAGIFYINVPEGLTPDGPADWSGCASIGTGFMGAMPVTGKATIGDRVLSVAFMSLSNYTTEGTVFTIKFKVDANAKKSDISALELNIGEVKTPDATHKGSDGEVTVDTPKTELSISCVHPESERVSENEIPATCTEAGNSGKVTCGFCGEVVENGKEIPAKGHTEPKDFNGSDDTNHWKKCTVCGEIFKDTVAEHVDENKDGKCEICGYMSHEHVYADTYSYDEEEHFYKCTYEGCTATSGNVAHTKTEEVTKQATCLDKGEITVSCSVCSWTETVATDALGHSFGDWTDSKDGKNHERVCTRCGETETKAHDLSTYTVDDGFHWSVCPDCGFTTEKEAHVHTTEIYADSTGHWYVCDVCGEKIEFDPHTGALFTAEKKANSKEDGNSAYWYCPGCGKYFYDDNGKIGAGPFDTPDVFATKYNVGCNGNHLMLCVPMGADGHMYICQRQCGFVMALPHNPGVNGVCSDCGYVVRTVAVPEVLTDDSIYDVDTPTEGIRVAETVETVK